MNKIILLKSKQFQMDNMGLNNAYFIYYKEKHWTLVLIYSSFKIKAKIETLKYPPNIYTVKAKIIQHCLNDNKWKYKWKGFSVFLICKEAHNVKV